MKVIGKRKPFKTNNSSELLYGLPLLWVEIVVMNVLGESCTAFHVINNCVEYNLVLQEGPFCSIIVRG